MTDDVIGIIGTGRMGTAFAKRLIDCGHTVHVWNRTAEKTATAIEAGATAAPDPAALVRSSDVILTSLTDFAALEPVLAGLTAADLKGKLVIEMSTLLPDEEEALAAIVTGAGAEFLECPVGGTVGPALKGQLLGFAGGSDSAWARARPILEKLCKRVDHLGPVGTGARMKLAVNLPLAIYWDVLGEALKLLDGTGLSGERIVSLLAESSAGPNVLKNRAQVVADTIDGTDQPGTFDIAGLAKDLRLALKLAGQGGATLPVAETVLKAYEAGLAQGLGGKDGASLARFARETSSL